MTREEYHRLLNTDYWRGFSYSIIKERNFTCEDCGRTFYNERNKLQVHHLVYRDINPWSYRPDELVVLCRECHARRHGINPFDDTEENQTLCNKIQSRLNRLVTLHVKFKRKHLLLLLSICIILPFVWKEHITPTRVDNKEKKEEIPMTSKKSVTKKRKRTRKKDVSHNQETETEPAANTRESELDVPREGNIPQESQTTVNGGDAAVMTHEKMEKAMAEVQMQSDKKYIKAVKKAKRLGISTDGTTEDILNRIKQAKATKKTQKKTNPPEVTILEKQ